MAEMELGIEPLDNTSEKAVLELMHFFCMAWKQDSSYRGTVCFNFSPASESSSSMKITVRVDEDGVSVFHGLPTDDMISVEISMPMHIFLKVYSGKTSYSEVARMFLSKKIWVSSLNFQEVTRFAAQFEYSRETWQRFYAAAGHRKGECPSLAEILAGLAEHQGEVVEAEGVQLFSTIALRASERQRREVAKLAMAADGSGRPTLFTLWLAQEVEEMARAGSQPVTGQLEPWWNSPLLAGLPGAPAAVVPALTQPIHLASAAQKEQNLMNTTSDLISKEEEDSASTSNYLGGLPLPGLPSALAGTGLWLTEQMGFFVTLLDFNSKLALCQREGGGAGAGADAATQLTEVLRLLSKPKAGAAAGIADHGPALWASAPEGLRRMLTAPGRERWAAEAGEGPRATAAGAGAAAALSLGRPEGDGPLPPRGRGRLASASAVTPRRPGGPPSPDSDRSASPLGRGGVANPAEADFSDWWAMASGGDTRRSRRALSELGRRARARLPPPLRARLGRARYSPREVLPPPSGGVGPASAPALVLRGLRAAEGGPSAAAGAAPAGGGGAEAVAGWGACNLGGVALEAGLEKRRGETAEAAAAVAAPMPAVPWAWTDDC